MSSARLCELLEIELPIIQGGLAYLGTAELAAAVSEAGALGQLTAGTMDPSTLREQIRLTRRLTSKPFGVSVALGRGGRPEEKLQVIVEEGVSAVSLSAGNPVPYIEALKRREGIKVLVVVSSVAHAVKAEAAGADAVVAEGFEAAGHNGTLELTTMALVPQVVDAVGLPVIAAGGIADGRGLVAALALGASGVQLGTRLVATEECIAHPRYKRAIVEADDKSTLVIERGIGRVTRVLDTSYARKLLQLERTMGLEELLPWISGERNRVAAVDGLLEEGYAYSSQAGGLIKSVMPVREVLASMMSEASSVLRGLPDWGRG